MLNWRDFEPFFTEEEFACQCGCGSAKMDRHFMKLLYALRLNVDAPMIVSSGFRCPVHNNNVSSTGMTGPHTTGKAADVRVMGLNARTLLGLIPDDFTGIGISQKGAHDKRFIHLDTLNDEETAGPRPWVWSY